MKASSTLLLNIESFDIVPLDDGIELRMWLSKPKADRLQERRRHIAGPTGCGLCGIDSIAEAMRPAAIIEQGQQFSSEQIMVAMQNLPMHQKLNIETRAVHAAAFWGFKSGIVALREDVGRHNALDKLSGALARASVVVSEGIILLSSRVSVEMVQKSAAIGAPVMGVGFSADGSGRLHGGCSRYHTCRHCARGRIRSVHASLPHSSGAVAMLPIGEGAAHGTQFERRGIDHEDWNRWCGKGWLCMCARGLWFAAAPETSSSWIEPLNRAKAVATDLRYGTPLCPRRQLSMGIMPIWRKQRW